MRRSTFVLLVLLAGAVGCGGGGGGPPPVVNGSVLSWTPPKTFEDNTILDPSLDLDRYEFYARPDEFFDEEDPQIAEVGAVDNAVPVSSFHLGNLAPFVPPGARSYLSIRAVGLDGSRSPFSEPVVWYH